MPHHFYNTPPPPNHSLKITRLQIPRHTRQPHNQPIQLPRHHNLTPQPRRLRQPKRQIQHIVLVIVGLRHGLVLCFIGDNNVARRARARPAARALHLQVVRLRDVEEVGARGDGEGVRLRVLVDEGYVQSGGLVSWVGSFGRGRRALRRGRGCRGARVRGGGWLRRRGGVGVCGGCGVVLRGGRVVCVLTPRIGRTSRWIVNCACGRRGVSRRCAGRGAGRA